MPQTRASVSSSDFALYFIEALNDISVQESLKKTLVGAFDYDQLADRVSQKLQLRITTLEATITEQGQTIQSLEEKVDVLENKIDDLEQYSRRSSVRISGLKETENENVAAKVGEVMQKLGLVDEVSAINRMHRVGPKPDVPWETITASTSRPVLVQFKDYPTKYKVM